GHEVLLAERRRFLVPALLARTGVERHEVVVRRDEEEVVAPHRDAAVADVRAALRLPEVVPDLLAVVRVERPDVVGGGDVEDAVHREHRALDLGGAADGDAAVAFTAGEGLRTVRIAVAAAGTAGDPRGKGERQV